MALQPPKCFLVASLILAVWASHAATRELAESPKMPERHRQWMARHGRVYKGAEEQRRRFKIFKANLELVERFNAGKHKYNLGVNRFADLTNDEFKAIYNGFRPSQAKGVTAAEGFRYGNATAVPSSIDWRAKGAVTPIKDQGQCGSCWAFSAVAATEGITQIKTGELISLSEQELVDCTTGGEDRGCDGGVIDDAFEFIATNGGLAAESTYPYQGADGTCNSKKESPHAASVKGFENVAANSEAALLMAVANQPVSVAVDAGSFAFQFYSSGVFTGDCGTDLDHGVTAVGYGTASDATKYWLVKNSWGSSWGEEGYVRMERDVGAIEGLCGIAMLASYPTA